MSAADLDQIEQLASAATEGPWWAWDRGVGYVIALGEPADVDEYGRPARELPEGMRTDIGREADAEFIAAARTAVPELVAEVRRLRAELAWATDGPGPDITTVYDRDGDPWERDGDEWRHEGDGGGYGWRELMDTGWGPFTATPPAGGVVQP